MAETLTSLSWAVLRLAPPLVLLWLALHFGQTLRPGSVPLIERIARRSTPTLPSGLCRYTRRLTALWCAYFVVAALVMALAGEDRAPLGLAVWGATAIFFVGERCVRPWFFPGESFPGLVQQLRDTLSVWRNGA